MVEEKVDNVEVEKDLVIHISIAKEFNKSLGTSIILFRSAFHETQSCIKVTFATKNLCLVNLSYSV